MKKGNKDNQGTEKLPCEERVNTLGLFSLGKRHWKGSFNDIYEIFNSREKVNRNLLFMISRNTRARGRKMELFSSRFKTTKGSCFSYM